MRHRRSPTTLDSSGDNDRVPKPSASGTSSAADLDAQETETILHAPAEATERPEIAAQSELEALFRSFTDEDFGEDVARIAAFGKEPIHPELESEVRAATVRLHNFFQKAASDPAYGDAILRKLRRRLRKTRTS